MAVMLFCFQSELSERLPFLLQHFVLSVTQKRHCDIKKKKSCLMFLQSFLQRAKHATFGGVDEVFEKITPSHDPALWPAFSSSCKSLLLNGRVPVSTDPQTLVINILMNATLLGALTRHHLPLFFPFLLLLLLLRALRFCCVFLFMEVARSFCGRQIA